MATAYIIRISQVFVLSTLVVGCGPQAKVNSVGKLDLSTKGATCAFPFHWNTKNPCVEFVLQDTNGAARSPGSHFSWPLEVQVDVFDLVAGKLLVSSDVKPTNMCFTVWELPATSVELTTPEFDPVLQNTNSYKFVLTVLHEEKGAGPAEVKMVWVEGGDSM